MRKRKQNEDIKDVVNLNEDLVKARLKDSKGMVNSPFIKEELDTVLKDLKQASAKNQTIIYLSCSKMV